VVADEEDELDFLSLDRETFEKVLGPLQARNTRTRTRTLTLTLALTLALTLTLTPTLALAVRARASRRLSARCKRATL
jgi:hypothetical protein